MKFAILFSSLLLSHISFGETQSTQTQEKRTESIFQPTANFPKMKAMGLGMDAILPTPQKIDQTTELLVPWFSEKDFDKSCKQIFPSEVKALTDALKECDYLKGTRPKNTSATIPIIFEKGSITEAPERVRKEAYSLEVTAKKITIRAEDPAGAFYAIQTLRQILPTPGNRMSATGKIIDWPSLPLRGQLHDTGRNFQEVSLLKKQIDLWSRYKINTFHFHFTDNPGWRFQSLLHPELQNPEAFSRHVGKFYTHEDVKDLIKFAKERHVTIIPELDIPGHSAAFRRAYKLDKMNAPGVKERFFDLIDELCSVASPEEMPYIHLGTDEVQPNEQVPKEWLEECHKRVTDKGYKVIGWNKGIKLGKDEDSVQHLWARHSGIWNNRPYIDSQNSFYINHVDPFELLAAFSYQKACNLGPEHLKLGAIMATWHDDAARNGDDVILMNAVYPASLLFADNVWRGRKDNHFDLSARLPEATNPLFSEAKLLESKLIQHRDKFFAKEPFPYVKQTDLSWKIIGPFDNKGKLDAVFPPETQGIKPSYTLDDGKTMTWWEKPVYGATIYPRHFWFPSYLKENKGTIYAFTQVYSPKDQTVGAWIGFDAWSRSDGRQRGGGTPPEGKWSKHESKIWINGKEIAPPKLTNHNLGGAKSKETPLIDEDYFYRAPTPITLKKGWNTVLIKAPQTNFWKWVFTFMPVQATGNGFNAIEVPGVKFSPSLTEPKS